MAVRSRDPRVERNSVTVLEPGAAKGLGVLRDERLHLVGTSTAPAGLDHAAVLLVGGSRECTGADKVTCCHGAAVGGVVGDHLSEREACVLGVDICELVGGCWAHPCGCS